MPGVMAAGHGVERDEDATAGGDRKPGQHELGPVRHDDGDAVTRLDPRAQVARK